jgi:hypothetical protein
MSVRIQSDPMQKVQPTATTRKARICRPFAKRLMGFEPTTFCMASRAWGYAECLDFLQIVGVSAREQPPAIPVFHREIMGVWGLKAD